MTVHTHSLPPVDAFEGGIGRSFELLRRTSTAVSDACAAHSFPLILSGNSMASAGVACGLDVEDLGLIYFDASCRVGGGRSGCDGAGYGGCFARRTVLFKYHTIMQANGRIFLCLSHLYLHAYPYRPLIKPPKHHTNISHNSQNVIPTCPHNRPREMLKYSQVATHLRSYQRHTATHSAAKRTATLGPFCVAAPFF
jgi:hypothetical protein